MRQKKQPLQRHTLPSVETEMPATLFDLDGTLIDRNYQHVSACSETLLAAGAFRVYSDAADMLMHIEQLGLPGK
jgi:phosphoglycolate phosphatase-like HAD superfamily hydrolase